MANDVFTKVALRNAPLAVIVLCVVFLCVLCVCACCVCLCVFVRVVCVCLFVLCVFCRLPLGALRESSQCDVVVFKYIYCANTVQQRVCCRAERVLDKKQKKRSAPVATGRSRGRSRTSLSFKCINKGENTGKPLLRLYWRRAR